jgi:hypothetical protein
MTNHSSRRRVLRGAAAALGGSLLAPVIRAEGVVQSPGSPRFAIGENDFLLDGKPMQIRCGEIHFARVPREYWSHRLKAIRAMGLNTVCAYLFWNFHEWREGKFDWSGRRDAAEFCRLAQQEGLWVILRPGPYACAEWEMGGLPWWLLKQQGDNFLRTRDERFVTPARRWMAEVGRVLGPMQITRGGSIIMVQVENEYGYYGEDKEYMRVMRRAVLDAGFDVPLFACNPTHAVEKAHMPELFSVANFGADPATGFNALAKVQKGPRMCGEFYPGWFDTWGSPHRRGDTPRILRDLAWVFIDGKPAGAMDTRFRRYRTKLPKRDKPVTLDILVYTIARVNFGVEVHDRKGLHGPVRFVPAGDGAPQTIEDWEIRAIDFDADAALPPLKWRQAHAKGPAFWRGTFRVANAADTFLDMSKWGQGAVWVNGQCLGRYWNIGPTQTMYLPGPWLKAGDNEIVVLDLSGPEQPHIAGVRKPVLDELHPQKDTGKRTYPALKLDGIAPIHHGTFAQGAATQEIRFNAPVNGWQFCLESLDAYDGKEFAAVAELALLDAQGKVIDQSSWTIAYASSEEAAREDGSALNAINGQASDYWHTAWSTKPPHPKHPHRIVVDLGVTAAIGGFRYTPRQGLDNVTGRIRNYNVYVGMLTSTQ